LAYYIPNILSASLGLTIRQRFPAGGIVPGKRSRGVVDRVLPDAGGTFKDVDLDVVELLPGQLVDYGIELDAATGGLFEPSLHVREQQRSAMITAVHTRVGTGVTWSIYLTDGRGTAADPAEVDDPAYDILLAAGSGNARTDLKVELSPGARIRFVTDAVTALSPAEVDVVFVPHTDTRSRGNL
jgi:hypothetical protein